MAKSEELGIELDDVISELQTTVEDAVNFMFSEFGDDWERAERYFAGGSDVPVVAGRSEVVKTEFRDVVRAVKPSIMRTLLHARKPVEFLPAQVLAGPMMEQQSLFINQLFDEQGGYRTMLSCIDEALKKKGGPIKTYWEENPIPTTITATGVTVEELELVKGAEDCELTDIEEHESPIGGDVQLFDIEYVKYKTNGQVRFEAFPIIEYFCSRNAQGQGDHGNFVHGHRRDVTVGEALMMGLDYDDWNSLDADDPEQNQFSGESAARRSYFVNSANDLDSDDLINKRFLLTQCYCEYDIEGLGYPQKYLFHLGGTSYQYLDHHKIEDWEIDVVQVDPVPFTQLGRSLADLTLSEQDLNTSILRAITDNFHMANNPRPIANPMLVDFNDLMNNAIGGPIKAKQGGTVDTYDIPFTGQQGLPLLQYLEMDVQNKVGVTKAAQGLDPDAMQSTDAEAVKNTIMLAQGQVELMVRNIVETGLLPAFKKLLRLTVRHMDRLQTVRSRGMVLPIDTAFLDPDAAARPNVGLGTGDPDGKTAGLMFFLGKQEEYLQKFGLDNPLVSLDQVYNTYEDLAEVAGFVDVGRYFKLVTPEMEKQLAAQRAEAAKKAEAQQQENVPMDPSKALMAIEGGKGRLKELDIVATREQNAKELRLKALMAEEEADLKRDQMAQDRIIELRKIQADEEKAEADARIKEEQARNQRINTANAIKSNGNGNKKQSNGGGSSDSASG